MSGAAAPKRPLYARVLRLHYVHPGGLVCFFFFEGMILLAVLLALAELVTWWIVIILPVSVAAMVKINDVIAGLSFTQHGKAVLPRRIPAVARGSAAVEPTVALPASVPVPGPSNRVVGRAVGRAVGTAPAPGSPGRTLSPHRGASGHSALNRGPSATIRSGNGAAPGAPETVGPATEPVGDQRGHGPAGADPNGGHADPSGHAGGYVNPNGHVAPKGHADPNGQADPKGHVDPRGHGDSGGHGAPQRHIGPQQTDPQRQIDPRHTDPTGHSDPTGHIDPGGYSDSGGRADPNGDPAAGQGTPLPRRRAAWHGPNQRRFDHPA